MTAVAVLGTGIMGAPMARNLAGAGHDVRAWNRTAERAQPLAADGVTVAGSAPEAVAGADVVLTMLSAADAVLAVAADALPAMDDDAVWLQASTIGLEATERAAALARERGVAYVDAPVLGTKAPAEAGQLVILASGPPEAVARCRPVFDAIGARTLEVGAAGAGMRLKLVVNGWVLAVTQATAETVALAEALGVGAERFFEAVDGGPLDLPYARAKAALMADDAFPASFALALAAKDAGLVADAAEQAGADVPVARAVAGRLREAADAGQGDEDMAATYRLSRADGG
jgi:3-hydroxyisobutyrate dehydrogenase